MIPYPKVREFLIDQAHKEKTVNYQELCNSVGLKLNMTDNPSDRATIGKILGDISAYEHLNKRPLLSSVVVAKGTMDQGDGFFKLAEELGYGSWKKLKKEEIFEIEMMSKTFQFWKNKDNYAKER